MSAGPVPGTGRAARIAALNDAFRKSMHGGRVVITAGVNALPPDVKQEILEAVRGFQDFGPDNDPWGEHDFGSLRIAGHRIMWKIDYYDADCLYGSEDPSDPAKTTRVMTILLAQEY